MKIWFLAVVSLAVFSGCGGEEKLKMDTSDLGVGGALYANELYNGGIGFSFPDGPADRFFALGADGGRPNGEFTPSIVSLSAVASRRIDSNTSIMCNRADRLRSSGEINYSVFRPEWVATGPSSTFHMVIGADQYSESRIVFANDTGNVRYGFRSSSTDLLNLEIRDGALWSAQVGRDFRRALRLGTFATTRPTLSRLPAPLNAHNILIKFNDETETCRVITDTGIDRTLSGAYCGARTGSQPAVALQTARTASYSGRAFPFVCWQNAYWEFDPAT